MLKSVLRSPVVTAVLFVLAAGLLLGGSIGAVQAAPRIVSNDYRAEVVLTNIETALTENGVVVEGDDTLLGADGFLTPNGIAADGSNFQIGRTYDEPLAVLNVGTIDEYVRVTVSYYWEKDGKKVPSLDPSLIELHFVEDGGWSIDHNASTDERTVLYYAVPIAPGQPTSVFADKLTINEAVLTAVTENADGSVTYDYEGARFCIKAVADAVQTHNGEAAMTSAWGRTV